MIGEAAGFGLRCLIADSWWELGGLTPDVGFNMEEAGERFQFRFNPKVDASPDEMIDFLIEKMKDESVAAQLKRHLNLEEKGAYKEFLKRFAEKAKTDPKVMHVNDYSGI